MNCSPPLLFILPVSLSVLNVSPSSPYLTVILPVCMFLGSVPPVDVFSFTPPVSLRSTISNSSVRASSTAALSASWVGLVSFLADSSASAIALIVSSLSSSLFSCSVSASFIANIILYVASNAS